MAEIASQIPPRVRRVVELGCGRGETGAAFLRRQPEAVYWGLTTSEDELQEASKVLTHAACVLPEELNLKRLGIYEAEVLIIRGDYVSDLTAEKFRELVGLLAEKGLLIMETHNPAYVRRILAELDGDSVFQGGLDRKAAIARLEAAGLKVYSIQARYEQEDKKLRESAALAAFKGALPALCNEVGQAVTGANILASGFLLKARREPLEERENLLVHTALGETIVTPRVRIIEPGQFLSTEPGVRSLAEERHSLSQGLEEQFARKIFIRQRTSFSSVDQGLKVLDVLRKNGYLVLSEIDDNPFASVNTDAKEPQMELPPEQELSYLGIHGVQVSTETLADLVRRYNSNVKVFRNELTELPQKRNYAVERLQRLAEGEDYVTFFFGALNRTREWQEVMPVITEAIKKYGSKLRFKVLSDKGFYKALPTEYKKFIGTDDMYGGQFVPYSLYQEAMHSSDISFLPLRDTAFNRTKSDLKFIESAGHGAVVLASPTVYEATVREGRTGFIYRSPKEFGEMLALLVENRERRLETAEAAYNYVRRERLLANHYQERLDWYQEMVDRRQELDRELSQRVARWQENLGKEKGGKP